MSSMRRSNLFQSHVLRKSNDLSDAKGCYRYGQDYLLSFGNGEFWSHHQTTTSKTYHGYSNRSHPHKDKDRLVCLDGTINDLQGTPKCLVGIQVGNPQNDDNSKAKEKRFENGSRHKVATTSGP
jgi:hypothetical protein